jgi:glucosamine 6-phosphate synthetase-like amidotransferase/phosphosugar isomerase protein
MCGIVGAASTRNVVPILIEGIRRLEYRGYDSTGTGRRQRRGVTASRAIGFDRARRGLGGASRYAEAHRDHRHIAHALGNARRADRRQRASASIARRRDRRRS